jgi:hypothetical protein
MRQSERSAPPLCGRAQGSRIVEGPGVHGVRCATALMVLLAIVKFVIEAHRDRCTPRVRAKAGARYSRYVSRSTRRRCSRSGRIAATRNGVAILSVDRHPCARRRRRCGQSRNDGRRSRAARRQRRDSGVGRRSTGSRAARARPGAPRGHRHAPGQDGYAFIHAIRTSPFGDVARLRRPSRPSRHPSIATWRSTSAFRRTSPSQSIQPCSSRPSPR